MTANRPRPFVTSGAILGLALAACASQSPPRAIALDPSNPAAPEAPIDFQFTAFAQGEESRPAPAAATHEEHETAKSSDTAAPAPPADAAEPEAPKSGEHDHVHSGKPKAGKKPAAAKPGPAAFVCPMHPEIGAKEPGRCPKCGMKLEPVQTKPPRGAHQ